MNLCILYAFVDVGKLICVLPVSACLKTLYNESMYSIIFIRVSRRWKITLCTIYVLADVAKLIYVLFTYLQIFAVADGGSWTVIFTVNFHGIIGWFLF